MIVAVTLNVSFPVFGRNYFTQSMVMHAPGPLIEDDRFDPFLIPAAERHFNNGIIGFNDQFRFLSDVLDAHLESEQADSLHWQDHRPMARQQA